MNIKERLNFITLEEKDVEELIPIMKDAFNYDSNLYLGKDDGPEGYDNGDFIRRWGLNEDSDSYKILLDDKIVGMVILWINNETQENFLGNIFIDVKEQNKKIGETVWKMIEEKYPNTKIWRTETPGFSTRNHYFYVNKCGFKIVKIVNQKDKNKCIYNLEKVIK